MKHQFDPRTRQLIPTGKLSPYEGTAEYNVQRSKIEMVSIWIDEVGLKWKVHDDQEGWNLKPMGWPADIRACITEEAAVGFWTQQTEGRHAQAVDCTFEEVRARHNHEGLEYTEGCLACTLQKRKEIGRPAERAILSVLRDVIPEELIEQPKKADQHKKKRWMSETYHKRIQKKWNKRVAGQTELVPRQEIVQLSLSKMALTAIRKHAEGRK